MSEGTDDWDTTHVGGRSAPPKSSISIFSSLTAALEFRVLASQTLTLRSDEYAAVTRISRYRFRRLWQKSFDTSLIKLFGGRLASPIPNGEGVVVLGYSLPETDVSTQATLRMDRRSAPLPLALSTQEEARRKNLANSSFRSSRQPRMWSSSRETGGSGCPIASCVFPVH